MKKTETVARAAKKPAANTIRLKPSKLTSPKAASCAPTLRVPSASAAEAILNSFPFDSERSRVSAMAALLTVALRPMLGPTVPGIMITSNRQGAGKSTLASLLSAAAAAQLAIGDRGREAMFLEHCAISGVREILFEDAPARWSAMPALNCFITQTRLRVRKFHTQDLVEMPNVSTVIITSTRLRSAEDDNRRFLRVGLWSPTRPSRREPTWNTEDRFALYPLVGEMLTNWKRRGSPLATTLDELGHGFPQWHRIVWGIVGAHA